MYSDSLFFCVYAFAYLSIFWEPFIWSASHLVDVLLGTWGSAVSCLSCFWVIYTSWPTFICHLLSVHWLHGTTLLLVGVGNTSIVVMTWKSLNDWSSTIELCEWNVTCRFKTYSGMFHRYWTVAEGHLSEKHGVSVRLCLNIFREPSIRRTLHSVCVLLATKGCAVSNLVQFGHRAHLIFLGFVQTGEQRATQLCFWV